MDTLTMEEMQKIQRDLREKYKSLWGDLTEKDGRSVLLWTFIELGEVADIIKKDGDEAILHDPRVRSHFIEELSDVVMFLNDAMICYGITPEEMTKIYREKAAYNLVRWENQLKNE